MKKQDYKFLSVKEDKARLEALGYKFSGASGRKHNKLKKRMMRKATRTAIKRVKSDGE